MLFPAGGTGQLDELYVMLQAMPASARRAGAPDLKPDRPLYEEIRGNLTEGIAAGRWRAGEAIPSESDLARHFGVAIGTIRKAVDSLVAQGGARSPPGQGHVRHRPRRPAACMFHFFHIVGARRLPGLPGSAHRLLRAGPRGRHRGGGARHRPRRARDPRAKRACASTGARSCVDDLTLPSALFPGLTRAHLRRRATTRIYHLYQSRYGINVLRTDERLARDARRPAPRRRPSRRRRPGRRCSRSAASRSPSATGPWSTASRA